MPKIKIKTTTTPGRVPNAGSLQKGELASNLNDKTLFIGDASGNPIKVIDSMGHQDDNNIAITGGAINGTSISATSVNSSNLQIGTTESEYLYYNEGTNASAYTANWNNSITRTMADFGGFANLNAHGWVSGPANYTLLLNSLPAHTAVRYYVIWHLVDSLDNETNYLYTTNDVGSEILRAQFRKTYTIPPVFDSLASGTTASWHGQKFYTFAPWGGANTIRDNGGGNGYIIFDTGWIAHTASSISVRHYLGADQAVADEAEYLSHVKLYLKGPGVGTTSVSTSSGITESSTTIATQNAVKTYLDNNLPGALKNVYTYTSSGTYTKSGSDVKRIKVVCVGAGGGARGWGESGGAGGYSERLLDAEPISSVGVTVSSSGGAGGGYYGYSPAGGTTSFGAYCSATGGYGANNNTDHTGGIGGIGSGGNINKYGGGGAGHHMGYNNQTNSAVGRGGSGFFGGSRNSHHSSARPGDHGSYGAGASASVGSAGGSGSTGRGGICIVYEYR